MNQLSHVYRHSLALLTDLYQLTMACGYWKNGLAEREAVFHLTFRKAPFGGQFAVACGLAAVVDLLENFGFNDGDVEHLATLRGADDRPLFGVEFLSYLRDLRFVANVDAAPEGTLVFPHEPLLRVTGPILQCQVIESALLTLINFPTLVATKSARICAVAQGDAVLEFGLRRAQGIDGSLTASRAAYVGGCAATSNVLAGKLFGIPVKGTHAHSWVMTFDDELSSFDAYADALPNNCIFLVDTYDTRVGVQHAIEVGRRLRKSGHEMLGIRLDSGDLAQLSIEARQMLDDAEFRDAAIVASNDLDEHLIRDLKQQGATIAVWGVGTRLATAFDQPALGGVYKLSALRNTEGDRWQYKIKLSEQAIKISNPGIHQVRRYLRGGKMIGDVIYDLPTGIEETPQLAQFAGEGRFVLSPRDEHEDLLVPVFCGGKRVYDPPSATAARRRTSEQLACLPDPIKRLRNPTPYALALEARLHETKSKLVDDARSNVR